jgi:ZIP family zinc transporter
MTIGDNWSLVMAGTAAGLATGLATLVGALPVLAIRASERLHDMMLAFAAGVMLSASNLSLIVPAAEFATDKGSSPFAAASIIAIGVIVGAITIGALRGRVKVPDALTENGAPPDVTQRVWLLVIAMTAHNFPEGAAVGVGFGSGEVKIGVTTAIGIGVQNIPEGLAVAAALLTLGVPRWRAVLIAGATGLVEPIGAFLAAAIVTVANELLAPAMGWAAGAMLYIVAAELIPAVQHNPKDNRPIASFVIGLALMLLLDIALG